MSDVDRDRALYERRDEVRFGLLPRHRRMAVWKRLQDESMREETTLWPRGFDGRIVPPVQPEDLIPRSRVVLAGWGLAGVLTVGALALGAATVVWNFFDFWPWSIRAARVAGFGTVALGLMMLVGLMTTMPRGCVHSRGRQRSRPALWGVTCGLLVGGLLVLAVVMKGAAA